MQRLKGRSVLFGALAVLACSGDPTGNQSTPTEIQTSPDVVFVTQGDSQAVLVSVLDEDGNVLTSTSLAATADTSPTPIFQSNPNGLIIGSIVCPNCPA